MEKENAKEIWQLILAIGDTLKGKLPDHPNHPQGRNPYAHISIEIKNKYGCSYKEIPDNQISGLIDFINHLKKNPD